VPTLGIEPNGRTLDIEVITVDSVVDGVAYSRTLVDVSGVMAQIREESEEPAAS
jgi:hypothetical protein